MEKSYYQGFSVKGVSKKTGEGTVYVRIKAIAADGQVHETTKSTGVTVNPRHFRRGKVTARDEQHTAKNERIEAARAELAAIANELAWAGLMPDRQRVAQALQETADAVEGFRIAKARRLADLTDQRLQLLCDIEELELQLSAKRKALAALEVKLDIRPAPLPLRDMFAQWRELREQGKAGKKKAKPGTLKNIDVLANIVCRFRPNAVLSDIDLHFLIDFQQSMTARNVNNSSALEFVSKFKTVYRYFAQKHHLDTSFLADFKAVEQGEENDVLFLTADELSALEALPLKGPAQIDIRRQFLFAVETGLRRSDYQVTKANIKRTKDLTELVLPTTKTGKVAHIPFTRKAQQLFAEAGHSFKLYKEAQFNQTLRAICKKIPALHDHVTMYRRIGDNTVPDTRAKWEFISSHVARKTYAYNALARGASTLAVAQWLGHKSTKMLDKHYTNKKELARREAYKVLD